MKNKGLKYLIIGIIAVLIIFSIIINIIKYKQKHRDVLKDTNVTVDVVLSTDENNISAQTQEDLLENARLEEEAGYTVVHGHSSEKSSDQEPIKQDTIDNTDNTDNIDTTSEDGLTDIEDSTTEKLQFSYNTITKDNYVNFMEQLSSIDFKNPVVDIDNLPLTPLLYDTLLEDGCVNKLALDYGFITTDNGFNDEDNTFYVLFHTPNEARNYILIQGLIVDNKLDDIQVMVME